jgi:hypothetical protein
VTEVFVAATSLKNQTAKVASDSSSGEPTSPVFAGEVRADDLSWAILVIAGAVRDVPRTEPIAREVGKEGAVIAGAVRDVPRTEPITREVGKEGAVIAGAILRTEPITREKKGDRRRNRSRAKRERRGDRRRKLTCHGACPPRGKEKVHFFRLLAFWGFPFAGKKNS